MKRRVRKTVTIPGLRRPCSTQMMRPLSRSMTRVMYLRVRSRYSSSMAIARNLAVTDALVIFFQPSLHHCFYSVPTQQEPAGNVGQ